jgi:hypothetical protein
MLLSRPRTGSGPWVKTIPKDWGTSSVWAPQGISHPSPPGWPWPHTLVDVLQSSSVFRIPSTPAPQSWWGYWLNPHPGFKKKISSPFCLSMYPVPQTPFNKKKKSTILLITLPSSQPCCSWFNCHDNFKTFESFLLSVAFFFF